MLLDRGAKVNAKESAHGQTALMFAAALNRAAVVRLLMDRGADSRVATPVRKMASVRFDQDGNVVEDKPGAKGPAAKGAAGGGAGDDHFAAMEAVKAANAAAKSELDVLAHALKMKSAEYPIAKPKAKAGDVAFRAPRKVGAEFMGGMTALLYAAAKATSRARARWSKRAPM